MSFSKNPPIVEETQITSSRQNHDNANQVNNLNSPIAPALFSEDAQSLALIPSYPSAQLPRYDWENKWLKGDEYAFILENIDKYCAAFDLRKFERKTHPENIYRSPQNGLIYFVEGNCVGSEFGFPRVPFRKQYRWKKMNFTTDLPKKRPQVTYIVASSVRCQKHGNSTTTGNQKSNSNEAKDIFRMHAVILYKSPETKEIPEQKQLSEIQSSEQHNKPQKSYILCHVRKIDTTESEKSSLVVGGSSSNEISPEVDQDKIDQSEEDEEEDNEEDDSNRKNLQGQNKLINVKRKSISQTTKTIKTEQSEKASKSQSKDQLKLSLKQQDQLKLIVIPEATNSSAFQQQNNPVSNQLTLNNSSGNNISQGFRKLSECSGKNGCQAHESPTLLLQSGSINPIGILTNRSQQILNPLNSSLKTHSNNHSRKDSSNSSSVSNPQQYQQDASLLQKHQQPQPQRQQQILQNPFQDPFYKQNLELDQISNRNCNKTNISTHTNSNINNLPGLSCSSLVLGSPVPPISTVSSVPPMQIPQQTQGPLSGLQLQLMLLLASQQQQQQQQQAQMQQQQQQQLQLQQQQQFLHLQQSIMNTPEKSLFNLLTLWQKNPSFGDLLYNILQRQVPGQEIDYYNLFSLSHSPNPPTSFLTTQAAGFLPNLQQPNCINNNSTFNSIASVLSGNLSKNNNVSSNNTNNQGPQ